LNKISILKTKALLAAASREFYFKM
jgi:hypothetical protein